MKDLHGEERYSRQLLSGLWLLGQLRGTRAQSPRCRFCLQRVTIESMSGSPL